MEYAFCQVLQDGAGRVQPCKVLLVKRIFCTWVCLLLCLLSQGGSFCSPAPYLLLLASYPCPVLIDPLLRVPCDHQVIIYYSVLILTHFTSTLVNMAVIASNLVKNSLSLLPQLGHDFLSWGGTYHGCGFSYLPAVPAIFESMNVGKPKLET